MAKLAAAAPITTEQDVRDKLVPIVLGGDILGYTYVREFHRVYGVHSIVLASANVKFVSCSRFCEYRIVEGIDDEKTLVDYLDKLGHELAAKGKVGITLGSGDWYARILSANKERLGETLVIPYIDFDLLDDITQKERFYGICEELGIPYPKTWRFDCNDPDLTIDAESFTYPLIAKPSNSARYHYAEFPNKKKIFEVETPEELTRIFEALKASCYDRELIVQDFIPGGDDGLYSITTFSDDNGEARMTAMGRVVLQDHHPLAIGNPVCIMGCRVEHVIDDARKFLRHTKYHGFANFDVKYDPRNDTYCFFEVNTRPGRNSFYVTLAGSSFARLFVEDYVLGHEIPAKDASNHFIYACVPPYVVKRTVDDPDLRFRVLQMYKHGLASSPLDYPSDTLKQRMYGAITYWHQISKFKKYVWDTGGKQADLD